MKENIEDSKIANELISEIPLSKMTVQLLDERNKIFETLSFEENNIEKSGDFFKKNLGHLKNNSDIESQYSKVIFELQKLRNEAIKDKNLIYDKDGQFQYAIAPNGQKSNLDEFEWCMFRVSVFKEMFGDWEKLGKDLLKNDFKGWNIKTSYDELLEKLGIEIKNQYPELQNKPWTEKVRRYLKDKYNIDFYGPYKNKEIYPFIQSIRDFVKEVAIREGIDFYITYPSNKLFQILEDYTDVTKDLDENGEPRIEYHGGSEKIRQTGEFKLDQESHRSNRNSDLYFFTPDKNAGEAYAEIYYKMKREYPGSKDYRLSKNPKLNERYKNIYGGEFLSRVVINLKKPKFYTRWWDELNKELSFYGGLTKNDRENGYDGFIMNKSKGDLQIFDQYDIKINFDSYAQSGCVHRNKLNRL